MAIHLISGIPGDGKAAHVLTTRGLIGEECIQAIGLLIGCTVAVRMNSGRSVTDIVGTLRDRIGGYSVCVVHREQSATLCFTADDIETMTHEPRPDRWLIKLKHTTA